MTKDDGTAEDVKSDTSLTGDVPPEVIEPDTEMTVTIMDIKGTYIGTLHNRPTTLKITDQTDSSFSGKITINYREVMNQDIKGIFSPTTLKFSMSDQIHSRSMGKYNGKISTDGSTLSGTFIPDYDKLQTSFNLKKK
jgi:hypothetical protein